MKKKDFGVLALVLALVLVGQAANAYAYTITRSAEERYNDAVSGDSFKRVTGHFTLDSSHPAEGEVLLPSMLGMTSFVKVSIDPSGPAAWPIANQTSTTDVARKFAFDYTANRFYVLTTAILGGGTFEVSGPITYDLDYLTKVPFEAVGAIS